MIICTLIIWLHLFYSVVKIPNGYLLVAQPLNGLIGQIGKLWNLHSAQMAQIDFQKNVTNNFTCQITLIEPPN